MIQNLTVAIMCCNWCFIFATKIKPSISHDEYQKSISTKIKQNVQLGKLPRRSGTPLARSGQYPPRKKKETPPLFGLTAFPVKQSNSVFVCSSRDICGTTRITPQNKASQIKDPFQIRCPLGGGGRFLATK